MTQPKSDIAVVIGRFQIPHEGHISLFKEAQKIANKLVIIVGSVGQPRTPKNPFTFAEREEMLEAILDEDFDYEILGVQDQRYNLQHWIVDVVNKVKSTFPQGWTDYPPSVVLVGHEKDSSSFYLDLFPQWKRHDVESVRKINATDIRNEYWNNQPSEHCVWETTDFLYDWMQNSQHYEDMVEEYIFLEEYKKPYKDLPYPPIFHTVDAVVVQSGHILLIKRKSAPGKGLWALPGGFVNPAETLKDAMLRELVEETQIKLQRVILERSIKKQRTYDDPDRSQRGRTITEAFYIELSGHDLPRVKGADDAEKAKWIPLNEVFTMGDVIYEDHLDIIMNITGDR